MTSNLYITICEEWLNLICEDILKVKKWYEKNRTLLQDTIHDYCNRL